jgi:hypothetical protein
MFNRFGSDEWYISMFHIIYTLIVVETTAFRALLNQSRFHKRTLNRTPASNSRVWMVLPSAPSYACFGNHLRNYSKPVPSMRWR